MTKHEEEYSILINSAWELEPHIKVSSIQDAVFHVNKWLRTDEDDGERITPIVVEPNYSEKKGWYISLSPDRGSHCRCDNRTLTFLPFAAEKQQEGWIRGNLPDALSASIDEGRKMFEDWQAQKKDTEEFTARAIGVLSDVVMNLDIPRMRFGSWSPNLPIQNLVEKLACNRSSTIEFSSRYTRPNKKIEDRNMELCTKLLEQGNQTKSWKALRFMNLSKYSAGQVQDLLEAVECHTALETLDLRADRRIHTWLRYRRFTKDPNRGGKMTPEICVFPLVKGLSSMSSLQTLDLSGQRLTHESAHALIGKLNEVRTLTKLLLRDTCLDGASMRAVARLLMEDSCGIQILDISHNEESFADPAIMKEPCTSLKANTTLKVLRLEHFMLKTPHYQVLAEALPGMKGLQHLSILEDKKHRQIPFCVTNEDFLAYLAEGPGIVVDALEGNHNLLTLDVAQGITLVPCCTIPPYDIVPLDEDRLTKLRGCLRRNNEAFDGKSWAEENVCKKQVDLPMMDRSYRKSWLVDWFWTKRNWEREQRASATALAQ